MYQSLGSHYLYLDDLKQFPGRRVFLRGCLNAPMEHGELTNTFRLRRLQPTIAALRDAGAKIILAGYLTHEDSYGFAPVAAFLGVELLDILNAEVLRARVATMCEGEVVMLPNLRRDPREEANDPQFAAELASLADVYVNDAFPDSHREYASIIGIPKLLPSFIGPQFQMEVEHLSRAFTPSHPFLFILGGAKFSTKEPLVSSFLDSADQIFITGALANTFFKAKGYETGISLIEPDLEKKVSGTFSLQDQKRDTQCPLGEGASRETASGFLHGRLAARPELEARLPGPPSSPSEQSLYSRLATLMENKKILLPLDVTVQGPRGTMVKKPEEVLPDENMLDVGPASVALLKQLIGEAKFVLWNGPLGNFEKGFSSSTDEIALALAASSATSIVGGGDTLAALNRLQLDEKTKAEGARLPSPSGEDSGGQGFSFVSTGGGAMLDFLAHRTLPGIKAVNLSTYRGQPSVCG